MKVIENAIIKGHSAYYPTGGLILGTQRIPDNHQSQYWQGANLKQTLSINPDSIKINNTIREGIFIGRIPQHIGHFIMEGLPRLCDVPHYNKPLIGTIVEGVLPEGIYPAPKESIMWVINQINKRKFYELDLNKVYRVRKLFVPDIPTHLSHTTHEPWRMQPLITILVENARKEHPNIKTIDKLWLKRYEDEINDEYIFSEPENSLSLQIAMVSHANELYGRCGSNTHFSIFAKANAIPYWSHRGGFEDTRRNQLICDLIKTYNKHKI